MSEGIGNRLSSLIAENGISNYVLAKEIELNDSTISRIINKNQKPRIPTLKKICAYFNIEQKWLLTGTSPKYHTDKKVNKEKLLTELSLDERTFNLLAEQVSNMVVEKLKEPLSRVSEDHNAILFELSRQAARIEMINSLLTKTKLDLTEKIKEINN